VLLTHFSALLLSTQLRVIVKRAITGGFFISLRVSYTLPWTLC
jgi:hypothetical protein